MKDFELSPKKEFRLKYGGQVYSLRRPTTGEILEMEDLEEAGKGGLKLMVQSLAKLGLPEAVSREMEITQLRELIEALIAKKN